MIEIRDERKRTGERKTYQELFLLFLCTLVIETTGLDNLVVDIKLIPRTLVHGFLHALLGDEPENQDRLGLTDTMRTILGLQVSVGVPVGVEAVINRTSVANVAFTARGNNAHDDSISGLQVQAKTTCTCREDEDFVLRVLLVKQLHERRALLRLRATIQAKVLPSHHLEEVLHDVHDFRHLEEDKDL